MVIAAAGDISGLGGEQSNTAKLLLSLMQHKKLAAILALGDLAYDGGTLAEFMRFYEPFWGAPTIKALTRPVPGNHEYVTGAQGYFDYFNGVGQANGPAAERGKGWYSYDLGGWHMIALNSGSECLPPVSCAEGSPQLAWLKADLARHKARCTLAYWHHPRFHQGSKNIELAATSPLWDALYDAGADVVLTAHEHNFQQFAPMNKRGQLDRERGIRSFVVGTGGGGLYAGFGAKHSTTVEYKQAAHWGLLELTLKTSSYTWRFVKGDGAVLVSGVGMCH